MGLVMNVSIVVASVLMAAACSSNTGTSPADDAGSNVDGTAGDASNETSNSGDDSSAGNDVSTTDAAPDAPPDADAKVLGKVGDPCSIDADCAYEPGANHPPTCLKSFTSGNTRTMPGGYCSSNCSGNGTTCGSNADCRQQADNNGSVLGYDCLKKCPGGIGCRTGYNCSGGDCYP